MNENKGDKDNTHEESNTHDEYADGPPLTDTMMDTDCCMSMSPTPAAAAAAAASSEESSQSPSHVFVQQQQQQQQQPFSTGNNNNNNSKKRPAPTPAPAPAPLVEQTCISPADANSNANASGAVSGFVNEDEHTDGGKHHHEEHADMDEDKGARSSLKKEGVGAVKAKSSCQHAAFWKNKLQDLTNAFKKLGGGGGDSVGDGDGASDGAENSIIAVLRTIPHMQPLQLNALKRLLEEKHQQQQQRQQLVQEIAATQAAAESATTTAAQNHDISLTRADLVPGPQRVETLMRELALERALSALKDSLANSERDLQGTLIAITMQAFHTEGILSALSNLSQAEGSITQNPTAAIRQDHARIQREQEIQAMLERYGQKERYNTGPGAAIKSLINDRGTFPPTHVFSNESLQKLTQPSSRLGSVSKVFQGAFTSSTILNKPSKQEQDAAADTAPTLNSEIEKTVDTLNKHFRSALDDNEDDDAVANNDFDQIRFPGSTSNEVAGVQPIVLALLEAVANCVQLDLDAADPRADKPSSPPKTVSEQKFVFGGEGQRERKCDACIWKRGRSLKVMVRGSMEVTIELKPGRRTVKSISDLRGEALDQSLSHLAKSLLDCLHFAGGAGVASYATSIIGTLVYIEVLQLTLIDPGTEGSRVELCSSGPLPLVSPALFDKWFGISQGDACDQQKPSGHKDVSNKKARQASSNRQNDSDTGDASDVKEENKKKHRHAIKEMRKLLFPHPDSSAAGNTDESHHVPLGLKALYALMASSRQDLVGPDWKNVSRSLGPLLGTGTFGMVFRSRKNSECAIKVSKTDLPWSVENEATILLSVAEAQDRPQSIPQLLSAGWLDVTIGGVPWQLPAIAMKPVGQDIYPILLSKSNQSHVNSIIDCILNDISVALKFLHDKHRISHNDVSDRNILLVSTEIGNLQNYRAVLVDFGVASPMDQKRCGVAGTPPFVHREVLVNADWFPVPEYDKTSLGLTLVVLLARGVIPWARPTDYEERLSTATKLLDEHRELQEKTASAIRTLIELDKKKFRGQCKCRTNCRTKQCGCRGGGISCSVLCGCYNAETLTFDCENVSTKKQQKQEAIAPSNSLFEQELSVPDIAG